MSSQEEPLVTSLRQSGSVVAITIKGSDERPRLEWRSIATGMVSEVAELEIIPNGFTFTEDLREWANEQRHSWTLWAQERDSSWSRVRFADEASVGGLAPVGDALKNAFLCPTGKSNFVIRTAAKGVPAVKVSTLRTRFTDRVRWQGRVVLPTSDSFGLELAVTERKTGVSRQFPVKTRVLSRQGAPRTELACNFEVKWADLPAELSGEPLDFALVLRVGGLLEARAGVPGSDFFGRLLHPIRSARVDSKGTTRYYGPFRTFRANNLAAHVAMVPTDTANTISRTTRFLRVRRLLYRLANRPLWVVGETGFKAQDTGLHLFRYLRQNHPEIDARFVVHGDSPDRQRVESVGPVLVHGTPGHAKAVLLASRLIGSHHPDYLYPVRTREFKRKVYGTKVFQQHGIMGTKWMANLYGRGVAGFETDCFLVSSPSEKAMIERDFGYRSKRVVVTGLARFDALLAPSSAKPQLLVIPTWRDWVKVEQDLLESEFYERWAGLLRSPEFQHATREAGWDVKLILHPNFREFAHAFEAANVTVVRQGEETVQELLRTSAVLLTDYSSVAFDFALLGRSVVYFQFDRERFLGKRGSHLDLDKDLPGEIAFDEDSVIQALGAASERGGTATSRAKEQAQRFFPMMDQRSAARVYDAVKHARPERFRRLRLFMSRATHGLYRRFRRSPFYIPCARALYKAATILPVVDGWVIFESGLGKQYGDSPKAIYQCLSHRYPELRKTWIYGGRIPDADDATDVIPRLSLRYYYALARAKYWVNNQSFPHYIRRRKRQVFVQTWHGTPLKKMGRDLDVVHGRDAGYLKRALTGARQWSVLVSPNRYTSNALKSAFGFTAEVLEVGYPRNDVLHADNADRAERAVRRTLGIAPNKRLVLFAPTFRDRDLGRRGISPVAALGFQEWLTQVPDDVVLLLRRHVLDKGSVPIPEHAGRRILDVTAYPDMQDLLAAADVLVTDYSSVYFDYLNRQQPIVFFAPDLDDYRDVVRGFYLDYESDLPGPLATEAEHARQLIFGALEDGVIRGYDLGEYAKIYCALDDGRAAERVVDHIFGSTTRS